MADEESDKYILLTDIEGYEDGAGHMDFKITGTASGITAIQLDMKVKGIPMELLPKVFEKSKIARLHILEEMKKVISEPKDQISEYAPKMVTIKIDPEKIGMVIGAGGKTIKEIQSKTGAEIGIDEDGSVFISAETSESAQQALDIVDGITKEVKVGDVYDGKVDEITDFGAFVEILPGRTGLLHVSEISHEYVTNVADHLKVGDEIKVKVIETSIDGKMSLSKKALEENPNPGGSGGHGNRSGGHDGSGGGRNDRRSGNRKRGGYRRKKY